ncbi:MAG: ABC transporter permease [Acidimicrobiales bacterium]|nr:ABC transporter permease [Acidimicrobiales bacterium]
MTGNEDLPLISGSSADGASGGALTATFADKKPKRSDNKTVTFGDAGAVRSLPMWSVISLITMIGGWYVATKAWGFPGDFAATQENPDATDKVLLAACNRAEECGRSAYTQLIGPTTFPSMRDTWSAASSLFTDGFQNKTIWTQIWASLWRVIRGMFFGTIIGVPIGLFMGLNSKARGFFDTPVEMFRPIPPLALIPLFILTFGIGDKAAVPLLIFASVWIMIIAARAGVRNASLQKVRAAYSLGASKWQLLSRVLIPNALPEIFTGIRVALGVSWGTLVAAELVGTDTGLGAMIFQARNFSRLDIIVVGIIIIAIIGVLMDLLLRFLESILIPWQGKG